MVLFAVFLYVLPCFAVLMVLLFLCLATRMANEPSLSDPRAYDQQQRTQEPEQTPEEATVIRVTRCCRSVNQDLGKE